MCIQYTKVELKVKMYQKLFLSKPSGGGGENIEFKAGVLPIPPNRKTPCTWYSHSYVVLALVDAAADELTVGSRRRSPAQPVSRWRPDDLPYSHSPRLHPSHGVCCPILNNVYKWTHCEVCGGRHSADMCYCYMYNVYKQSDLQTYSKHDLKKSFCMNPVSQCGSGQSSKPTRQELAWAFTADFTGQNYNSKVIIDWQSYVRLTHDRHLTACRAENHQIAQQNVS